MSEPFVPSNRIVGLHFFCCFHGAGHFSPHGVLSVLVVLVHGRRGAGHFSPRRVLLVLVVLVRGRRRARHFSPCRVLSVIVILVHGLAVAEPDGAFHLVMMSQNQSSFGRSQTTPSLIIPTNATRSGWTGVSNILEHSSTISFL